MDSTASVRELPLSLHQREGSGIGLGGMYDGHDRGLII